jgi:hypothetical protein
MPSVNEMTSREQKCKHCHRTFIVMRVSGRPREFCYRPKCRYAMKLAWGRSYRRRIARGEHVPKERLVMTVPTLPPPPPPKPVTWWVAQAMGIVETCRACEGPVEGIYIAPTTETKGECAVVAHCRLCGRERMVLAGRAGVPYEDQSPGQLRGPREVARRVNTSRRRT